VARSVHISQERRNLMYPMISDVAGLAAMAIMILVVTLGAVYFAFFKGR
jgi:hypothetical protein